MELSPHQMPKTISWEMIRGILVRLGSFALFFRNMEAKRTGAIMRFRVSHRKHAISWVFFQTLEIGFHANVFS
jgi:hypothetical protein